LAQDYNKVNVGELKKAVLERIEPEKPATAENILIQAHSQDCCVIFAHPFSYIGCDQTFFSFLQRYILENNTPFQMSVFLKYVSACSPELLQLVENVDAIETQNGLASPVENLLARKLALELNKPQTGGSDAHGFSMIGRSVTVFPEKIFSSEELVSEIKTGRTTSKDYLNAETVLENISYYVKAIAETGQKKIG